MRPELHEKIKIRKDFYCPAPFMHVYANAGKDLLKWCCEARYNKASELSRTVTSMTAITEDDNITITALTLPEYRRATETRIELSLQSKFPSRSQGLQASTTSLYSLPTSSTYAVIDATTNEVFIPHNTTGSLISTNNKHFIDIDMNSLFPERYYTIQVKVPNLLYNGSEQFYETNTHFKVIK